MKIYYFNYFNKLYYLYRISDVAANVSIAYKDDIWQNDMIYKDQDDCSKMLVCELNR